MALVDAKGSKKKRLPTEKHTWYKKGVGGVLVGEERVNFPRVLEIGMEGRVGS